MVTLLSLCVSDPHPRTPVESSPGGIGMQGHIKFLQIPSFPVGQGFKLTETLKGSWLNAGTQDRLLEWRCFSYCLFLFLKLPS